MDIREFLLARIAEDEAAAAKPLTDLPVTRVYHPHTIEGVPGHPGATVETTAHYQMKAQPVTATYNADPARVLRECAAKRTILATHRPILDPYGDPKGATCTMCADSGSNAQGFPCSTVRALAAVYSDHPDYQEEWKP